MPPPTRKIACRLTTDLCGLRGREHAARRLYKRGLQGKQIEPDLYARRRHVDVLDTCLYRAVADGGMARPDARQLRPNAYLRLIENRWVSSDSTFVEMEWWDACIDP